MKILPASLGLALLTSPADMANSAVSGTNGKFGAMHGSMNSESATSLEGSIAWPIQDCFGIQLDGLYSSVGERTFGFSSAGGDTDFGGVGGHIFWRDSGEAMLGLEAGYVFSDIVDSYELGLEAEYYFDWLTIGAKAGAAWVDSSQPLVFVETDDDGVFGQLYLGAYPLDNLLITAFVENRFDITLVGIEAEYELPVPGLSIFASATKAEYQYDQALVGMRYYFGEDKPLKRRHRESDPKNHLPGILTGIESHAAKVRDELMSHPIVTGGSLGGSGTIGGSMNLSSGSSLVGPGNSSGTLTVDGGNLTLGGGTLSTSGATLGSGTSLSSTVGVVAVLAGPGADGVGTSGGAWLISGSETLTMNAGSLVLNAGSVGGNAGNEMGSGYLLDLSGLVLGDGQTWAILSGDFSVDMGSISYDLGGWDIGFFDYSGPVFVIGSGYEAIYDWGDTID